MKENEKSKIRTEDPVAEQHEISEDSSHEKVDEITYATTNEKIGLFILLLTITIICLFIGEWTMRQYDDSLTKEVKISWETQEGVILKPGPVSFNFDREESELLHRGQINDELKAELISLIDVEGVPADQKNKVTNSYNQAISMLAYRSNSDSYKAIIYLILLAGIGGLIGVQIRSISNFIGVTCFKDELDIKRWWPWYVSRPVLGFLLGMLVVILVKAQFILNDESPAEPDNMWWLGLAVLTGFGASDFTDRLRLLAQTLFGKNKD